MAIEAALAAERLRRDLALTLLGLLLVLLWDAAGLDMALDHLFGGAAGFPLREHWVTSRLLHTGGRWLATLGVVVLLLGIWWPLGQAARALPRADRAWWLLTTLACMALIPTIKHASHTSCPWDIEGLGGHTPWISHWAWRVFDGGPGHCFPSGHASAAFGFFAGYFVLRDRAPRSARHWLVAVLLLGLLYGFAQLVRGAHYASHSAWTAWICWAVTLASHHAWRCWCERPSRLPVRTA